MTEGDRRAGRVRPIAYAPAALLAAVVAVVLSTPIDDGYAFDAVFAAVGAGVVVTAGSVPLVIVSDDPATALRSGVALGVSLTATAVLVYLVVGCAFGCPA